MIDVSVKICCIQSLEEALLAQQYGAEYIGLVSQMPSGPGVISDEKIVEIATKAPEDLTTVLLTSHIEPADIVKQQNITGVKAIQLVRLVGSAVHQALKTALPDILLIQVVHVQGEAALDEAVKASQTADMLLLDSGNPGAQVLGGTGRTHDWIISRKIVEAVNIPVFLAGGLNPTNVRRAINEVQPYGIDVCSGVLVQGRLEESKLAGMFTGD